MQERQGVFVVELLIAQRPEQKRRVLLGGGVLAGAEHVVRHPGGQAVLIGVADVAGRPARILEGVGPLPRKRLVRLAGELQEHHQGLRTGGRAVQLVARLAAGEQPQAVQRVRALVARGGRGREKKQGRQDESRQ